MIIHDTAGEEANRSIMRQFYRNADIALIVYDITDLESFRSVREYWLRDLKEYSENDNIKIILVGNKTDKRDERLVELDVAEQYAQDNGMSFIEISAANEDHFDLLNDQIRTAARQVLALGGSHLHRSLRSSTVQLDRIDVEEGVGGGEGGVGGGEGGVGGGGGGGGGGIGGCRC